jgi:Fe2+ transport system protein B
VSTASVSTLPHLEVTDAKRILNEEEKKKRREVRKLKREAREKKKEQQRLDEKKARKEAKRLKREERRKRREARKKKEKEAKVSTHPLVSSLVAPKMVTMMSPTKFIARGTRKERQRATTTTNMPLYPLIIPLCL